jgi:hypothetical protein
VEPEGVDTQNGYICVASRLDLKLATEGVADEALGVIDREEVPHNYRDFVNAPVLASYRYNRSPHRTRLTLTPYDRGELVPAVVDMSVIKTQISIDNEEEAQSRTTVRYKVKNSREQFLFLEMPDGVEVWSVHAVRPDGRGGETATRVRASRKGGLLLVRLGRAGGPPLAQEPHALDLRAVGRHRPPRLGGVPGRGRDARGGARCGAVGPRGAPPRGGCRLAPLGLGARAGHDPAPLRHARRARRGLRRAA